jgi:hypothetical protein
LTLYFVSLKSIVGLLSRAEAVEKGNCLHEVAAVRTQAKSVNVVSSYRRVVVSSPKGSRETVRRGAVD